MVLALSFCLTRTRARARCFLSTSSSGLNAENLNLAGHPKQEKWAVMDCGDGKLWKAWSGYRSGVATNRINEQKPQTPAPADNQGRTKRQTNLDMSMKKTSQDKPTDRPDNLQWFSSQTHKLFSFSFSLAFSLWFLLCFLSRSGIDV